MPAVRQKLHLSSCADFRGRLCFALSPNFDLAAGETDYFYILRTPARHLSRFSNSAMLQTLTDGTVHEVRVVTSSSWHVSLLPSPKPLNANTDLAPQ